MRYTKAAIKAILWTALILLLLPIGASAAKIESLWVTKVIPGGTALQTAEGKPLDAVNWWYSNREKIYYLFLPAGAKAEDLRIWFTGIESINVNGKDVNSGSAVDFLVPGTSHDLTADKNTYTLKVLQSANVPALFLSTESGSVEGIHKSKRNEETGNLAILHADGSVSYDGKLAQIKGRGNASFAFPKKPYQIKLDKSTDLFGLGKAKTWILLADYQDNSLMRNNIAFVLADAVGLSYTSRFQSVDVYVNNEYRGTYLLCEKVEIGPNRIAINDLEEDTEAVNDAPLNTYPTFGSMGYHFGKNKGINIPNNPDDITGGYILELDYAERYKKEPSGFATTRGQPITIKEPESASRAQAAYISTFMQGFENAIFSKDGIDPKSGKRYSEFVDMDSLVKKYLVEEILKNYDSNRSSLYFYKPSDEESKLAFAGPVWDYNSSMGNVANERNQRMINPEYFSANNDRGETYYWLPALYKQPDFKEQAIKTYHEVFVPVLDELLGNREQVGGSLRTIEDMAAELEASAAMNFTRWPVFNAESRPVKTGKDYWENIAYVKNFLIKRMVFLAENWILE